MGKEVVQRNEVIFLYDAKDVNPNGDPFENKPRIDDETGLNLVTDTRLKRTVRDYIEAFRKMPVFISIKRNPDGSLQSREERLKELKIDRANKDQIFEKYIDLRLFGATIAVERSENPEGKREKGWSITRIGPVQFNIGRSLNRVKVETIKGTSVMPSESGLSQGTFIETSIVHYSLICFHGIVNENAGVNTRLQEEDLDVLFDSLWNGTKNLITRSKVGQQPRLLLRVIYKEKEFHIGDIHKLLSISSPVDEMSIRDLKEITLDTNKLIETLSNNSDKIEKLQIKLDPLLNLTNKFESLEDKVKIEYFRF